MSSHPHSISKRRAMRDIAKHFGLLGCTAFGGPAAHLGFFHERFVQRLRWLSDEQYAAFVALCQLLPGPASSQVGLLIGYTRGGHLGALTAWLCFTLPSAVLMTLFALSLHELHWPPAALQGLKIAALAVVAQALWGMARSLCPDNPRRVMATLSTACLLTLPGVWSQALVMLLGGLAMAVLKRNAVHATTTAKAHSGWGQGWWLALALGVAGSALWAWLSPEVWHQQTAALLRIGASVFGGGHVVLPMLHAEFVDTGWVDGERFQAAYGAAQALPGPLFTFAAFLGASASPGLQGWSGATLATVAIFLPSYALVMGGLPLWSALQRAPRVGAAIAGVNAAVVGVLAATWLHPMLGQSIHSASDALLAMAAAWALVARRVHPLIVIAACVLLRWGFSTLAIQA